MIYNFFTRKLSVWLLNSKVENVNRKSVRIQYKEPIVNNLRLYLKYKLYDILCL